MAHYPAHTLKYSPIERRLFCYVTNACKECRFQQH
ncbi:ISAzo13-like element transposase-related protein [Methanosarcina vacuolata]